MTGERLLEIRGLKTHFATDDGIVRAQFFSLREKEFVEAARALGASPMRQVCITCCRTRSGR